MGSSLPRKKEKDGERALDDNLKGNLSHGRKEGRELGRSARVQPQEGDDATGSGMLFTWKGGDVIV